MLGKQLRARLFGADAHVAGRLLYLNGHPVQIVGVTGDEFVGPERGEVIDLWPQGAMVPLYRRTPEWMVDPDRTGIKTFWSVFPPAHPQPRLKAASENCSTGWRRPTRNGRRG